MNHAGRREALRRRITAAGLDALLVTKLVNIRYLTGFTGSAGSLLLAASGDDRFVTDGRYDSQAAAQVPDVARTITREDGWLTEAVGPGADLGLESHDISWEASRRVEQLLPGSTVVPAPGHVEALREVKDDDEVAAIERACALADDAFAELVGWVAPGMTERQVGIRLDRTMVDRGAASAAFATIVAFGPNSAVPHHRPTERTLEPRDLVKLDFGALVDGYHSDMTRMVALGDLGPELKDVFAVVREAQQAGLEAVLAGVDTRGVDDACRAVIANAGHGERFVHGTGHGVGLEIHEAPRLAADAAGTLRDRAVVTVEPGVYLPGVGGVRIEDTVVVGPDGPTVLTRTPKDLVVL